MLGEEDRGTFLVVSPAWVVSASVYGTDHPDLARYRHFRSPPLPEEVVPWFGHTYIIQCAGRHAEIGRDTSPLPSAFVSCDIQLKPPQGTYIPPSYQKMLSEGDSLNLERACLNLTGNKSTLGATTANLYLRKALRYLVTSKEVARNATPSEELLENLRYHLTEWSTLALHWSGLVKCIRDQAFFSPNKSVVSLVAMLLSTREERLATEESIEEEGEEVDEVDQFDLAPLDEEAVDFAFQLSEAKNNDGVLKDPTKDPTVYVHRDKPTLSAELQGIRVAAVKKFFTTLTGAGGSTLADLPPTPTDPISLTATYFTEDAKHAPAKISSGIIDTHLSSAWYRRSEQCKRLSEFMLDKSSPRRYLLACLLTFVYNTLTSMWVGAFIYTSNPGSSPTITATQTSRPVLVRATTEFMQSDFYRTAMLIVLASGPVLEGDSVQLFTMISVLFKLTLAAWDSNQLDKIVVEERAVSQARRETEAHQIGGAAVHTIIKEQNNISLNAQEKEKEKERKSEKKREKVETEESREQAGSSEESQ